MHTINKTIYATIHASIERQSHQKCIKRLGCKRRKARLQNEWSFIVIGQRLPEIWQSKKSRKWALQSCTFFSLYSFGHTYNSAHRQCIQLYPWTTWVSGQCTESGQLGFYHLYDSSNATKQHTKTTGVRRKGVATPRWVGKAPSQIKFSGKMEYMQLAGNVTCHWENKTEDSHPRLKFH